MATIFGINRIQYCQASALTFNGVQNEYMGICPELTNTLTELCFAPKSATLELSETIENKERLYTAKLTFISNFADTFAVGFFAFVVTTNNGQRFLVGSKNRPRVVVLTTQTVSSGADGVTGATVNATFKAPYNINQLPAPTEPEPDTREFDICCGAIARPVEEDEREFEICCGQIVGEVVKQYQTTRWSFKIVNGVEYSVTQQIEYGDRVTPPPPPPGMPDDGRTAFWYNHWEREADLGIFIEHFPRASKPFVEYLAAWVDTDAQQNIRWYLVGSPDWTVYESDNADYNSNITPPATPPTREGFTFVGWTTIYGYALNDDGDVIIGTFENNYGKASCDRDFVAKWRPI